MYRYSKWKNYTIQNNLNEEGDKKKWYLCFPDFKDNTRLAIFTFTYEVKRRMLEKNVLYSVRILLTTL